MVQSRIDTQATFTHDANGNMTSRTIVGVAYTQTFDVENRLESVITNGQKTKFYYDADGNRLLTTQPDGMKIYTPFAEYEETVAGGAVTGRSFYYLAGVIGQPRHLDRGFTSHRQNNTGAYDLGLIYMNARWARQSRPTINLNYEASTDFIDHQICVICVICGFFPS